MKVKSLLILAVPALFVLSCATGAPHSGPLLCNETPFFIAERTLEQTLVSGDRYYLEDIYNYDEAFLTNQSVIKEATDIKNVADYFAIMSVFDGSTPSVAEPTLEQMLASGTRYYLEDIYDYDVLFLIQPIVRQALAFGTQRHLEDIYDYDEMFFISQLKQTPVSGTQDYLADLYDYDETFPLTPSMGETFISGIQ